MIKILSIVLVIFSVIVFSTGCGKDPVRYVDTSINLVTNPSFEEYLSGSYSNWDFLPSISGYYSFSNDVPKDGGSFSLVIKESWGIPNKVSTSIVIAQEYSQFRFSCWAKVQFKDSKIWLGVQKQDTIIKYLQFDVNQTNWTNYVTDFNYNPSPGDTLKIFLEGSISSVQASKSYFDLVKVVIIK